MRAGTALLARIMVVLLKNIGQGDKILPTIMFNWMLQHRVVTAMTLAVFKMLHYFNELKEDKETLRISTKKGIVWISFMVHFEFAPLMKTIFMSEMLGDVTVTGIICTN